KTESTTVYSEKASMSISDIDDVDVVNSDYYVIAKVVAVNSTQRSDEGVSGYVKFENTLMKPELEVVRVNNEWKIRLANAEAFENAYLDGSSWKVNFKINAIVVNKDTYTIDLTKNSDGNYYVNTTLSNLTNYALRGYAEPQGTDASKYIRSSVFSANIFVPNGNYATTALTVLNEAFSGTNTGDLSYSADVTLTTSAAYAQTYRAELLGSTDGSSYQTTVAYKDINLSNGVSQTVEFGNLSSDLLQKFKSFKVAMYYAETGLGPVHTYYEITDEDKIAELSANTAPRNVGYDKIYDGGDYTYYYADPIYRRFVESDSESDSDRLDYREGSVSANLLDAPDIEDVTTDTVSGNLLYYFAWDQSVSDTYEYDVELYGIKDGAETLISTAYDSTTHMGISSNTARSFYMNADEYNYEQVKIKVTAKDGSSAGSSLSIGQSSEATFDVKRRLSKPAAIVQTITDDDEMIYAFNWNDYTDSKELAARSGYDVMISCNGVTNTLATVSGNSYTDVNMDDYAGKEVTMYLIGKSGSTSYVDSLPGTSITFTVAERYSRPSDITAKIVNIDGSDVTDITSGSTISENVFVENLGLSMEIAPGTNAGDIYLISGILCKDQVSAYAILTQLSGSGATEKEIMATVKNVLEGLDSESTAIFGFDGSVTATSTTVNLTADTLLSDWSTKYAGYYLIPFVRNAGSQKATSVYNWGSTSLALPKVKLDTPTVKATSVTRSASGRLYGTDYSNQVGTGSAEGLKIQQFEISTTGTTQPDYYEININGAKKNSLSGNSLSGNFIASTVNITLKYYPADGNIEVVDAYSSYEWKDFSEAATGFAFDKFDFAVASEDNKVIITMPNLAKGNYTVQWEKDDHSDSDSSAFSVTDKCATSVTCQAVVTDSTQYEYSDLAILEVW
ncbi:MAG: hypothetical protein K6F99_05910, partial [Lachnospiraceae bacterium]|nr:hypothetical protein [Lachnospiraceae bacterium]